MSINFTHNRVLELESVIVNTLLPVYKQYYNALGELPPYNGTLIDMEKEILSKQKLPVLLKSKDKPTGPCNRVLSFNDL